jgi:hypothetical protein
MIGKERMQGLILPRILEKAEVKKEKRKGK